MADFIVKMEKRTVKGALIFKSEHCVRWSAAFWKEKRINRYDPYNNYKIPQKEAGRDSLSKASVRSG